MKKIFLSGFLWFALIYVHAQSESPTPRGTTYNYIEWRRSINSLINIDNAADGHRGQTVLDELTFMSKKYSNEVDANTQFKYGTILNMLVKTCTEDVLRNDFNTSSAFAFSRQIPFRSDHYWQIVIPLHAHYINSGNRDSSLLLLDCVQSKKSILRDDANWNIFLAENYRDLNEYKKALSVLQSANRKADTKSGKTIINEQLRITEASVYGAQKEFEKCEQMLKKSISELLDQHLLSEPVTAKGFRTLAEVYEQQGNSDKALEVSGQYLKLNESQEVQKSKPYADMLNKHAMLAAEVGDYPTAIREFENLITVVPSFFMESDPAFILLLNNTGAAYFKSNQPHRAYVYFRWAYEMLNQKPTYHTPLAVDVISNLADTYSERGDHESAEYHFNEASTIKRSLQ